jgi:hypothetical protein
MSNSSIRSVLPTLESFDARLRMISFEYLFIQFSFKCYTKVDLIINK